MVQVPAAIPATSLPLVPPTVQVVGVRLLKVTVLPEAPGMALTVAVPPTANVVGVKLIAPMVWLFFTLMVCVAEVAAAKLSSPAWMAVMVQSPGFKPVTKLPLTLQIDGVTMSLKLTVSPLVAVALTVVVPPLARSFGVKVILPMLWLPLATSRFLATGTALL